jgi:MinD-like ATPase involved in chromosome partitioning or flagellar assembly
LLQKNLLIVTADMALSGGQIENRLGLPPTRTWPENVAHHADELAGCLVRHESGIFALPAPPPSAQLPQPAEVQKILARLREWHDYVLVDTPFNLGSMAPVLIGSSPLVLLLLTPDAATLRMAQASLAAIHKIGLRSMQVWPILNMVRPGQESFARQVEGTLKMPVIATLPWAPAECAQAVTNGKPLVLGHPYSALAQALQDLAQHVAHALTSTSQPLRRIPR